MIRNNGGARAHGIAFIGNFPPRQCGIATFTHDLAQSVAKLVGERQPVSVCAMNDIPKTYDYSDRVRFEVRQDFLGDDTRAADYLNFSHANVVSLQHELSDIGRLAKKQLETLIRETDGGKIFLTPYDNADEEELPTAASSFIEALGALL